MFPRFPVLSLTHSSNDKSTSLDREERVTGEGDKSRFCQCCGSKIPFDAKFCPNCGASQEREKPLPPTVFKGRSIKRLIEENIARIRVITFLVSLLVLVTSFFIGSQASLSRNEASLLIKELMEAIGPNPTPAQIALNNILISLISSIPLFGILFLALVSYNTGLIIAASAQILGTITPTELFLTTFGFPWTWLEVTAFSLASTQGIMLLIGVFTRNLRKEAKNFLISLAICLVLLGLGAVIEVA